MPNHEEVSDDRLRQIIQDPSHIYLVGMLNPFRLGISIFNTRLEYEHFPPDTKANNEFRFIIYTWQEIKWAISGIPKGCLKTAEEIAEACGLRIADGVPTIISGQSVEHFPLSYPNVFTLENTEGHEAYSLKPDEYDERIRQELQEAEAIRKAWAQRRAREN